MILDAITPKQPRLLVADLDGTLLHTLPDLVNVTNKALADQGFPPHTPEEILTYVGDGAARLIAQAVPADATPEQAERVFQNFKNSISIFCDLPVV